MLFCLLGVAFLYPFRTLTAMNLSDQNLKVRVISRMAPSSVRDDFEMQWCFSPLPASQSLLACHSLHCNIFCGSQASPLLRNQLSTTCNSALHCCFCSDRRAVRLLFLHNNSVAFRLTQSTSGLSTVLCFLSTYAV